MKIENLGKANSYNALLSLIDYDLDIIGQEIREVSIRTWNIEKNTLRNISSKIQPIPIEVSTEDCNKIEKIYLTEFNEALTRIKIKLVEFRQQTIEEIEQL
jgi:hypothetical protein